VLKVTATVVPDEVLGIGPPLAGCFPLSKVWKLVYLNRIFEKESFLIKRKLTEGASDERVRAKSTIVVNSSTRVHSNAARSVFEIVSEGDIHRRASGAISGTIVGATVHVTALAIHQGEDEARNE
jgi:hypothetical protein